MVEGCPAFVCARPGVVPAVAPVLALEFSGRGALRLMKKDQPKRIAAESAKAMSKRF